jgi:hypothetical protein
MYMEVEKNQVRNINWYSISIPLITWDISTPIITHLYMNSDSHDTLCEDIQYYENCSIVV